MSEPICSKRRPPRPQHPIFDIFRRGGLQFEHSVRRTHRQTGGITTIDPRHAGDTPTETFYGSNSPRQARGVGGQASACATLIERTTGKQGRSGTYSVGSGSEIEAT